MPKEHKLEYMNFMHQFQIQNYLIFPTWRIWNTRPSVNYSINSLGIWLKYCPIWRHYSNCTHAHARKALVDVWKWTIRSWLFKSTLKCSFFSNFFCNNGLFYDQMPPSGDVWLFSTIIWQLQNFVSFNLKT